MIKVTSWISSSKVRDMCIKYRYYTCGDCKAYEDMLFKAEHLDASDLEAGVFLFDVLCYVLCDQPFVFGNDHPKFVFIHRIHLR